MMKLFPINLDAFFCKLPDNMFFCRLKNQFWLYHHDKSRWAFTPAVIEGLLVRHLQTPFFAGGLTTDDTLKDWLTNLRKKWFFFFAVPRNVNKNGKAKTRTGLVHARQRRSSNIFTIYISLIKLLQMFSRWMQLCVTVVKRFFLTDGPKIVATNCNLTMKEW